MARKQVSEKKSKEIRRLRSLGLSERQVASAMNVHRRTVTRHSCADDPLKQDPTPKPPEWVEGLDWPSIIAEVVQKVPAKVIWEELHDSGRVPVAYANFLIHLRRRMPSTAISTMVRHFRPGERCEVDYSDGIEIFDPISGEIRKTHLFVGVLCFSRYCFAEFSLSQSSEDFLASHRQMFEFFGGVPHVLSPDNLKSAVTKAHRYDPDLNPAYQRLAEHYECAVVPARVRKPKDKAIVERTIQCFQRWFFFRVRKRTFTSLVELNQCLAEHVALFNNKLHRIFKRTRAEMFSEEKSELIPLPIEPYMVYVHQVAELHPDCHLAFKGNYYSAPHEFRGENLDVWATHNTVEIYHKGERCAFHARNHARGKFVTNKNHYPKEHQAYWDADAKFMRSQATNLGSGVAKLVHTLLSGPYPLQQLRRCEGIVRLGARYSAEALNHACELALTYDKTRVSFIERLAKYPALSNKPQPPTIRQPNPYLRGADYFTKDNQC